MGSLLRAGTEGDAVAAAQHELYAARYDHAAELFREALKSDPQCAAAYDGLVRALLESHHSEEAYQAADAAMQHVPGTAAGLAASGRALFRKGEIQQAEKAWRAALALDQKNAAALAGLAEICSLLAKFRMEQTYGGLAHRLAPEDPRLIAGFANSLQGAEHIAMLRHALAIYDPASQEAKALRSHISSNEALGDIKTRVLKSGNHEYRIKTVVLLDGPKRFRGLGLRVSFNGKRPATLLLDTGASGISLAPNLAAKFDLRQLGSEGFEMRGFGDHEAKSSYLFLPSTLSVGDLEFENYPVSTFESAKALDYDGLIGPDVFSRFLVTIDFPNRELTLTPFDKSTAPPEESVAPQDSAPLPAGFLRVYRAGHLLLVPCLANSDPVSHLFLIDSGSSSNLVDSSIVRSITKIHVDGQTVVKGVQGKVNDIWRADDVSLVFGGFRQRNQDMIALDLTKNSDDLGILVGGVLGMPVLINLKMTIDYRDAGIRFEYTH